MRETTTEPVGLAGVTGAGGGAIRIALEATGWTIGLASTWLRRWTSSDWTATGASMAASGAASAVASAAFVSSGSASAAALRWTRGRWIMAGLWRGEDCGVASATTSPGAAWGEK